MVTSSVVHEKGSGFLGWRTVTKLLAPQATRCKVNCFQCIDTLAQRKTSIHNSCHLIAIVGPIITDCTWQPNRCTKYIQGMKCSPTEAKMVVAQSRPIEVKASRRDYGMYGIRGSPCYPHSKSQQSIKTTTNLSGQASAPCFCSIKYLRQLNLWYPPALEYNHYMGKGTRHQHMSPANGGIQVLSENNRYVALVFTGLLSRATGSLHSNNFFFFSVEACNKRYSVCCPWLHNGL